MLVDTSGWLAVLGVDDRQPGEQARTAYEADNGPAILSPFVLGELDYLLLARAGIKTGLEFLKEVAEGVFRLAEFGQRDVAQARAVAEQYAGLKIGLADASIVVLAARYNTTRVLTLDHRHFRAMKPLQGGSFTILPADAG